MKKLLAVLALALIASPAFATIVGSPHDLSVTAGEELCVYCHTPHNASTTEPAPLWNRTPVAAGASYTGTGTFSQNGANNYLGTDVALCLSCHDGATAMNTILNAPTVGAPTVATTVNGVPAIGTDLTNDHPVGFAYAAAQGADLEIQVPTAGFGSVGFPGVLAGGTLMQCSSCHDVHNNTNGAFLVLSNADSGLCLQCHTK